MNFRVPFFRHDLGEPELSVLAEVLAGAILTTGEYVAAFERRFAQLVGRRHAVGVTSCTAALHLSLLALGIRPGDEVISTPMTFVATALAVLQAGAKPVFVDVEPDTGNLDAAKVERAVTRRTKAILPVHLYGLMCDMPALRQIADRHGLKIVEDAAHCVEGERDGERPGQAGETACFSFYATKNLTCGEGGAVATDDEELCNKLRLLRHHGMTKTAADRASEGYTHWDVVEFGWKYNMDNLQAALLLPQMDRLRVNLARRQELAGRYEALLSGIDGVRWPASRPRAQHARHLFTVWVDAAVRDRVIDSLQQDGIQVMVHYRPVHLTTYFAKTFGFRRGDFPVAERIGSETLSLPLYPAMPEEHVELAADRLKNALRRAAPGRVLSGV